MSKQPLCTRKRLPSTKHRPKTAHRAPRRAHFTSTPRTLPHTPRRHASKTPGYNSNDRPNPSPDDIMVSNLLANLDQSPNGPDEKMSMAWRKHAQPNPSQMNRLRQQEEFLPLSSAIPPPHLNAAPGPTLPTAPAGPNTSTSTPPPPPASTTASWKRISPIIQQLPVHLRHLWFLTKQVKSRETWDLLRGEAKQSWKLLTSTQNIKRTQLEISQRLEFLDDAIDRKIKEPYIEPTTEYRLQQKETLHDNIIDMHYARDRFIDKLRDKSNLVMKTIDDMNEDPRKREILARKVLFSSFDKNATTPIARMVRLIYAPFGLLLRSAASIVSLSLFALEVVTSRLIPEAAIIFRSVRKHIAEYNLSPTNLVQVVGLITAAIILVKVGADLSSMYMSGFLTPRGAFVDIAHTLVYVNCEEMLFDSVRELVANRLLVTPETYREMYDPTIHPAGIAPWGTHERYAQQQSFIQPIFTSMKTDLISLYKDRVHMPLERFFQGLREHRISLGYAVEALDGMLDALYMRDTRTGHNDTQDRNMREDIVRYLSSSDFLVLPPGDVIRTQAPGEIYSYVTHNFRDLEGKDSVLGGELFKEYLKVGAQVAYRKKLLHELDTLAELRSLLENARFPHVTIPQRDIKRIACDVNDPLTRVAMKHLEELNHVDSVTPLYPNREARQLLESSYVIDQRDSHYAKSTTVVNEDYLLLCNMDNPRYSYDTMCNHMNIRFNDNAQRDTFERHLYHLGQALNKLDAIMVQDYIELRRVEGRLITPLNPLEIKPSGVIGKQSQLQQLQEILPNVTQVVENPSIIPGDINSKDAIEQRIDPHERRRLHYRTLIEERKIELQSKYDAQNPTPATTYWGAFANWWWGTTPPPSYSQNYDEIITWQATRDVMEKINQDPTMRDQFMTDFAKDRVEKLQAGGYLSKDYNKTEMERFMEQATAPVNLEQLRNDNALLHPHINPIPTELDHYQISRTRR